MAIYGHPCPRKQGHKWSGVKPDRERKIVENVCRALRNERLREEISLQQLAELAGISRTGLRHIESLQTNATLYSLLRLAKALKVDLGQLLDEQADDVSQG
jgi:transcriptional regulator with XRE-family HTH domain